MALPPSNKELLDDAERIASRTCGTLILISVTRRGMTLAKMAELAGDLRAAADMLERIKP